MFDEEGIADRNYWKPCVEYQKTVRTELLEIIKKGNPAHQNYSRDGCGGSAHRKGPELPFHGILIVVGDGLYRR
jgi:hypothetical protein